MTEAIVNYLNLKLETVGRLGVIHCLAELRSDGTTTVPYVYSGTGQVVPINIDGGNLSYWRMDNPISFEPIVGKYGVNQMSGTYDLRLVVVARRKDSTVDDAFMPTRLAEDVANQITGSFPDLKLLLKAQSVNIRVNSIDTNIPKVWGEEFTGTQVNDLNYTRAIMALSVSVTVIGSRDCWQNECDIDPNILHIFDFCNPNVVAELTPTQVACLEDALCEPCADVTIDINGVLFDTVPSGASLDIPVLDTGANPVGSQSGTDYVIANNATYINSVQVTDQAAEQDAFIAVELDGILSGTWNAGLQVWEVTSDPCLDGNIELNGVQVATVASGGTEDIPVLSEGSNPVGSLVGSDWVIENNATTINGVQVTDQEAEQDAAIFVTRDGVQNGTWNAGIQTWEVTSAACSPVTFQINAVNKESITSGTTFNLITKLDGAVNSGSYDAPTDTLSFTSAATPPPSVSLAVSDITPDLGQVITLTAAPVNFTPTLYQFLLFNGSITLLAEQAGNIFNWTVNATAGSYDIYVLATDGTSNAFSFTSIVIQGDPDADAFIIAAGITDPTITSAINTLVLNFKTYGLWSKMSAIYPLVGGTATTHKWNLKNPLDTNAAYRLVFNGGVTHDSNGITGNGTNAYANTFLTDVSLDINNKHISMYQRNILLTAGASMGAGSTAVSRFYLNLSGLNYSTFGMFQSPVAVITPQRGMFTMSKIISGQFKYYQNTLTPYTRTGTNASSADSYALLAQTSGGDPTTANLSFASIGQGLSDTESSNLYTSVQAFQTTLGRQV